MKTVTQSHVKTSILYLKVTPIYPLDLNSVS